MAETATLEAYVADGDLDGNWTISWNSTTPSMDQPPPKYIEDLKQANKVIITALLAAIMVAMGCIVTLDDFKRVLRRPVGVIIGFLSQFVVLPLTAFGLAHALQLKAGYALGLLVTATCPGGVTSNLYTYWSDGDVCLSITMTTLSTTVAMGMMPLNLFIYSRSWTSESAVIPYGNIAIALALILVPVAMGMFIKYKKPSWCKLITRLGSIFGLLAIFINIILNGIINPSMFTSPWQVWFATFILPFLGYVFGYLFALALRRPHAECRTISFETGAQNIGLALALLLVTFEDSELLADMFVIPSLFGPFLLFNAMVLVGLYLAWKRWCGSIDKAEGAEDHREEAVQMSRMEESETSEKDKEASPREVHLVESPRVF
ncbi:ileal sodium/bile acid cotransporter-like [Acanthaster planci]|uniref:Ileal sodium/bile acid cotransporter-like n=1 Tax=Acanthaster planci TaxID=133434 RepID=A0A8B7XQE5_ACAPL|nr:ileal sodium/bile acid cotransporter-like [Acanthaster planci]XP_022082398.1 ileal sodium/bile acid cotransporter-like [Acanthaster planci]